MIITSKVHGISTQKVAEMEDVELKPGTRIILVQTQQFDFVVTPEQFAAMNITLGTVITAETSVDGEVAP